MASNALRCRTLSEQSAPLVVDQEGKWAPGRNTRAITRRLLDRRIGEAKLANRRVEVACGERQVLHPRIGVNVDARIAACGTAAKSTPEL